MQDPVLLKVGEELLLDVVIVMTVIQGAGPAEKVDIGTAVLIRHRCALGVFEHGGEMAAVGANVGFILFKNAVFH